MSTLHDIHRNNLESFFLLWSLGHALAFALALALGFAPPALAAVFTITNPIWAHARLAGWRRKRRRKINEDKME